MTLNIVACYRPPSAPSCDLDTICELITPHLSSELVLLGDLNCDMLNTPVILQSKLDALNLTQMINEPTRYNAKSVNTGTLIFNYYYFLNVFVILPGKLTENMFSFTATT